MVGYYTPEYELKVRFILTFRLCEENDEEERAATLAPEAAPVPAMDLDEVFGIGDDVDDDGGDDDGEPVRCLRRANALLSPSVLSCNLCTFTNQLVFGRGFDLCSFRFQLSGFLEPNPSLMLVLLLLFVFEERNSLMVLFFLSQSLSLDD